MKALSSFKFQPFNTILFHCNMRSDVYLLRILNPVFKIDKYDLFSKP
jgi:hypothetical protein